MSFTNLHQFTEKIIKNVIIIQSESFLNELNSKTYNYDPFLFFLIFNAIGEPYNRIFTVYDDLKNCELARLDTLNTMKINLLIIGIIIL